MKKKLILGLIFITICFALFFPFFHVGGPYYRGVVSVWYKSRGGGGGFINLTPNMDWYSIVWWANPFSLKYIGGYYAVDRNYVYSEGHWLETMDANTFKALGNDFYGDKNNLRMVSVLVKKKLSDDNSLQSFDMETFQFVGANLVKDKSGIYYLSNESSLESEVTQAYSSGSRIDVFRRIEFVDAETFVQSEDCVFTDKDFIYTSRVCGNVSGEKGAGIDFNSARVQPLKIIKPSQGGYFREIGCHFYITHKGVYFSNKEIKEADSDTFEIFNKGKGDDCGSGFYAKDKNYLYFRNMVVKDADPATFQVRNEFGFEGLDKNHKYDEGRMVDEFKKR